MQQQIAFNPSIERQWLMYFDSVQIARRYESTGQWSKAAEYWRKSVNGGKCRLSLFSDGSMKLGTQDLPHQILNLNTLQNVFYALTGNELQINL